MAKRGWEHSSYNGDDAERERVIAHRKKMEKECMTTLLKDLAPILGDGFKAKTTKSLSGTAIEVTLSGLKKDVSINFRYRDSGYRAGCCKGISIRGNGVFRDLDSLGRSYGFDFDTLQVKPAALKKMATAITEHLQRILDRNTDKEKRTNKAIEHAEKVVVLLEEHGFAAKVDGYDDDIRLVVKDICALSVSSTGLLASRGRYESVPIRASRENIVEVVKVIKHLREVIAGRKHP